MTAVICFPVNVRQLPFAKIYRANSVTDSFESIDSVSALNMEYEDPTGDYSKYYTVSFYDPTQDVTETVDGVTTTTNSTETAQVPVQSVSQSILSIIRTELNIQEDTIAASTVDFLITQAKIDVQMDTCIFKYGVEIKHIDEDYLYYRIPARFYYDLNCGGVVSLLDIACWYQEKPITIYSPKISLTPVYVDTDPAARYIQFGSSLSSDKVVRFNFYYTSRFVPIGVLHRLIAYRICAMYYENISISNSVMSFSSVKIGAISISRGSPNSTAVIQDAYYKMNAKYQKLLQNLKAGFVRAN